MSGRERIFSVGMGGLREMVDWTVSSWKEHRVGAKEKDDPHVELLFEEILTNIVRHSDSEKVSVACHGGTLLWKVTVTDWGRPFNPLVRNPNQTQEVGGKGLVLIHFLADRLAYERDGERNILHIWKGERGATSPLRT